MYCPTGRSNNVYVPMAFVAVVDCTLLLGLVATTCASAMTAPLTSLTVPVMVARSDWASASLVLSSKPARTMSPNFIRPPTSRMTKVKGPKMTREAPSLSPEEANSLHEPEPHCTFTTVPPHR